MSTVQGIDVSFWQGRFDWSPYRATIGFGMAKATEGTGFADPTFGHNWDSMWELRPDHRLPRFAYHFFRAAQDPRAQAGFLVDTVKEHGLLPGDNFVADFEPTSDTGLNDGTAPYVFAARAVEFLHVVNGLAPGHRILPYIDPSFARAGNSAGLGSWYLWVADYADAPEVPPPWTAWTFWQSGVRGTDLDVFNGDQAHLDAFTRMPDKR